MSNVEVRRVTKGEVLAALGRGDLGALLRHPIVPNALVPFLRHRSKLAVHGVDPYMVGYDRKQHQGAAVITSEGVLDWAASGSDSVSLGKNKLITAIMLVADPARFDGDGTNTPTIVEDAQDKIMTSVSVTGDGTYIGINGGTTAHLKALGNLNKLVYPGIRRANLPTGTGADQDVYEAWLIHLGVLNDYDLFDITAGIPAERLGELQVTANFPANNVFAATAAHLTIDTATDVYVVTFGVAGLPDSYLDRLPLPDFALVNNTSPGASPSFDIKGGVYVKRTTILGLAVAASNNNPRNDSNFTSASVIFEKPAPKSNLVDAIRWQVFRSVLMAPFLRGVQVDDDGSAAVAPDRLVGVAVIDWRRITKNPYGLSTYGMKTGDVHLDFALGTTTGSLHLLHEYYALPDPAVAEMWSPEHSDGWAPYRPQ